MRVAVPNPVLIHQTEQSLFCIAMRVGSLHFYVPSMARALAVVVACMAETLRIGGLFAMQEMAGTVGPPLPCTAFRLEAVPEMNYNPGATVLITS